MLRSAKPLERRPLFAVGAGAVVIVAVVGLVDYLTGHELSFSVFYLRDGLIDAVLSMNDSKTNELGGKLIERRLPVSESALADLGVDLTELVPTPGL